MVEAIVSYVVQKLGDLVLGEAAFLGRVKDDVAWLQRELRLLQGFVKDAEEKQGGDDRIRQWVCHIRDVVYGVEGVLDLFMLKVITKRENNFKHMIKSPCRLHRLGKKIKALKERISDLSRLNELYGLQQISNNMSGRSSASNMIRDLRRTTSFAREKDFVGLEDDTNKLIAQLLNDEPNCCTISILGTGGLGKTTIARKLYHSNEVRRKFDCCAWVCVSQGYKVRDLLSRVIKSFNIGGISELERMHEEDLERRLYDYLRHRSYLVVVDDVWEEEAWQSLRIAFPDNEYKSRIIITTRKKKVADCWFERTHVHELRFLTDEESWELFCKKAFWKQQPDEQIDTLGKEMVRKCRGLPLAIVVLAGLLSTKNPQEWHKICKNIWKNLKDGSIEIRSLLDLSFDDLPCELKLFFLYLSHYPEDYEIQVEPLIRQVVAEDLVVEQQGEVMEDIVKDNLHELINRSLVQIGKRCWGRVVTCRLHDLLRDLAITKAEELNFINIFDDSNSTTSSSVVSQCRRHAIYSIDDEQLWLRKCNPLARSLLSFMVPTKTINPICKNFTLLRVLVHSGHSEEIEEIGKLILLKYLRLKDNSSNMPSSFDKKDNRPNMPSSFDNLQKLQTLDFSLDFIPKTVKLPAKISKMKELRHLIGSTFEGGLSLSDLSKLQTLNAITYESWIKLDHEKFGNLRELHINIAKEGKNINLKSISKLKSLQILYIYLDHRILTSLRPFSCCPNLKELRIRGRIQTLPDDMDALLPALECVALSWSQLKKDPMPTLEKLPNLRFLELKEAYLEWKMVCTKTGFPRLEVLVLESSTLKELQIEDGAMPVLQGLRISKPNPELVIPERLRSIPLPIEQEYERDLLDREW